MKPDDQQICDALQALPVPPPSPEAQTDAWFLARAAWRESRASAPAMGRASGWPARAGWMRAVAGAGLACALLLAAYWAGRSHAAPEAPGHLLAEMEKLFPGQVLAVVRQDQTVDLQLGDEPAPVPTEQAVRIVLIRGTQRVEVLTYSGRNVTVTFDGRPTRLMPMLTETGALILITDDQVLAPGARLAGFEISAQRIVGFKT